MPVAQLVKTSTHAQALASVGSAKAWFQALPEADPKAAMDAVNLALSALLETDFAGKSAANTLKVLETLRKPMATLSQELSARYAGKSLPLSDAQRAAFDANITLAWTLAYAYYCLIEACRPPSGGLGEHAALIHQRALTWTALGMEEHLRARQSFADDDWDLAQAVLQSADSRRLLDNEVRDSLHPSGASSVAAAYTRLLLLHLTGARSLTMREFECARELAHFFENKAALSYVVADSHGAAAEAPKADEGDQVRVVQTGDLVHFLDVAVLSRNLRLRYDSLAQGKMFERPVLTDPPALPALKSLLSKLRTAWCSRTNQRQFPRRTSDDRVYAAFDPMAVYGLMKRRDYVAPPPAKVYDHHEIANIYLRQGDALQRAQQTHNQETWNKVKQQLEIWQAQDQSATGMKLTRAGGGTQVRQGQLMALRLGDAGVAVVAVVRWAAQTSSKARAAAQEAKDDVGATDAKGAIPNPGPVVEVGIQILPGLARAGAVRHIGARAMAQATAGKATSTPALILDNFTRAAPRPDGVTTKPAPTPVTQDVAGQELPEINSDAIDPADPADTQPEAPRYSSEATILLPAGWAREAEVIEFVDGPIAVKMRLGAVAQRHGDIERVHFRTAD